MVDEAEEKPFEPQAYRPRPAFEFEQIKGIVGKQFKIYESEENVGGVPGHEIAAFYVQSDKAEFTAKFEQVRAEIRAIDPDLMVILQYRMGEDVILVTRKPPVVGRGPGLNVVLFLATIFTTTLAGSLFYAGYEQAEGLLMWGKTDLTFLHVRYLLLGFLSFSLPVMLILGIHELGHFFVAKRHHVRTSFPYFIPVPPVVPIGTFGAFISIREPIPDRKALFDIGAAGPIAGFLATIPVLVIGLLLTNVVAAPLPPVEAIHAELQAPDGTTWGFGHALGNATFTSENTTAKGKTTYHERIRIDQSTPGFGAGSWTMRVRPVFLHDTTKVTVRITYTATPNHTAASPFHPIGSSNYSWEQKDRSLSMTNLSEATVTFDLPTNATALLAEMDWAAPPSSIMHLGTSLLFEGFARLIPSSDDILIHPTGFAGWVGLLVTGFNLLPAGQLDGGHVARAVLGPHMKWASYASVVAMVAMSYFFTGWLVLAVLILFLGIRHPPPLNDKTTLDTRRRVMAGVVLLILVVSFIPVPFIQ